MLALAAAGTLPNKSTKNGRSGALQLLAGSEHPVTHVDVQAEDAEGNIVDRAVGTDPAKWLYAKDPLHRSCNQHGHGGTQYQQTGAVKLHAANAKRRTLSGYSAQWKSCQRGDFVTHQVTCTKGRGNGSKEVGATRLGLS